MSSVVDTLFGGTDKSSLKSQKKANKDTQNFIRQQMGQSRDDIMGLWPGISQNRNMGYQQALDMFGQAMPQQMDMFQQGNMGAQSTLLAGLPQFQNAILGLPTDMSALQPRQINYDTSWMQQQLPDFQSPAQLLGGSATQSSAPQPSGLDAAPAYKRNQFDSRWIK